MTRARLRAMLVGVGLVAGGCQSGTDLSGPAPSSAAETTASLSADVDLDELCSSSFAEVEVRPDLSVGLLTDSGRINDGTFNQYAFEGMAAAQRCFGVSTTYIATGTHDGLDTNLQDLIDQGVDVILTAGFPLAATTAAAAATHPDVMFVGIDQPAGDPVLDNYAGVTFRDDQVGYLAGVAAARLSATGTVGIVAGPESVIPVAQMVTGFRSGVDATDPDVTVEVRWNDSFTDLPAGVRSAGELIDAGADVVFAAAGETGARGIQEAAARGVWVVGVDQDQYFTTFEGGRVTGADRLVTSAVKRVDLGAFLLIADAVQERFRGGPVVLDAASGAVSYAGPHDAEVPPGVHAALEEARERLVSGDLDLDRTS